MKIDFHKKFKKRYSKLDPKIKHKFEEKLRIFEQDPFDVSLNNHSLRGKFKEFRSIDVTGDWRSWYKQDSNGVIFMVIDTHSNLY